MTGFQIQAGTDGGLSQSLLRSLSTARKSFESSRSPEKIDLLDEA